MSDWWAGDEIEKPSETKNWWDEDAVDAPVKQSTPLMDRFLDKTSVGRVLDAFGQGAKAGWGAEPLGLSDESSMALRETGVFKDLNDATVQPLRAFNEAMIRPAAAGLDAVFRGIEAGAKGVANAAGQTAVELGADPAEGKRLTRDTLMLAETLGVVTGTVPFGVKPKPMAADVAAERAVRNTLTESSKMPETPAAVMPATEELIDKAGNINLDRIRAPEDVKNVIREAAQMELPVKADPVSALKKPKAAPFTDAPLKRPLDQVDSYLGPLNSYADRVYHDTSIFSAQSKLPGGKSHTEIPEMFVANTPNFARGQGANTGVLIEFDTASLQGKLNVTKPAWEPAYAAGEAEFMAKGANNYRDAVTSFRVSDAAVAGASDKARFATYLRGLEKDGWQKSEHPGYTEYRRPEARAQEGATETGFVTARRGVIPLKQTEELADALGMSAADLTARKVGESFNAEEAVAARKLLVQSATNVRDLAAKMHGGADTDVLAFQEAMTKHLAIQEQVAGMTAEAGRALSSFRILASATGEAKDLGEVIKQMGGRDAIGDIARKINELDTPEQVSQFLLDARKAKTSDMLVEGWINALLSGPQTHVSNIVSNTLVAMMALPETTVAAAIGAGRRALGTAEDSVYFGEAGARAYGILQGSKDGVIAGWRTYKTEIPSAGPDKLETSRPRAIPSARVKIAGKEFEIGGKQIRIPGRALMAEDEVFKAIGYRQELNALAYRQAAKEGLRGDDFAERVAEIIRHPTDAMMKKARETADYQTFTKELGKTGKGLMEFVNTHPALRVPFTFIRTPVNILKYTGERTPLAVLSKNVRAELKGELGPVARDTQIARIATGSAILTAAFAMASEGLITGTGPKGPRELAVLYAIGWQPQSILIGDVYHSYARMEPLAMLFGLGATSYELADKMTDPEVEDVGSLLAASIAKNMTSKTWLRGPAEAMQAATDPERYGERWVQRTFGTLVPTVVAQMARADDPYVRDVQSIFDSIQSRIPGQSEKLLPRRDIWGEPIKREGSLGPDMLSPIYTRRLTEDKVSQELLALKIWPAPLQKKVRGVELKQEVYDEYQMVAGRLTKFTLDSIVKQDGWDTLPDFARREMITKTITNSREAARTYLLMKHPEILQQAMGVRLKHITGSDSLTK